MKGTLRNFLCLLILGAAAAAQAQFYYVINADGTSITITGEEADFAHLTIPTNYKGYTVTGIGDFAFSGTGVINLSIPDGVTTLGTNAFAHCTSLTTATIPGSITNFAINAFYSCYSLSNVTLGNGLTSIGESAFYICYALANITIPDSVTSIGAFAFAQTALTNVTLPDGVTNIGEDAFWSCPFTSLTIPDSVTSIGAGAFGQTALTNVTIPNTLASINCFPLCTNLTSMTIPSSVTSIGPGGLGQCYNLTNVIIPGSVTNIGQAAFQGDTNLTRITIPNSVASIGYEAFSFCTTLSAVYFTGNPPTILPGDDVPFPPLNWAVFIGDNNLTIYYLPGTTGWSAFSSYVEVPAALWNPSIQASGVSFGMQSNQFGFDIIGTTNIPIVVEGCTNLAQPVWVPLQSMTLTNGLVHFSEPFQTNSSGRFYRIGAP